MKIVGTIVADLDTGEGELRLKPVFDGDNLLKADILQDVLHQVTAEYNEAIDAYMRGLKRRAAREKKEAQA